MSDDWERQLPWYKRPLRPPLSWFPINVTVIVGFHLFVLLSVFAGYHVWRAFRRRRDLS